MRRGVLLGASILALAAGSARAEEISGSELWSYEHEDGSEIVTFDPERKKVYVVGGLTLDVLDAADGSLDDSTSLDEAEYDALNSVAVSGSNLAVSATVLPRTDPGKVLFYNPEGLSLVGEVTVGAVPDMIVFTGNGKRLVVANEGEPSPDYTIDPEGSVSVIDVATRSEQRVSFAGLNGRKSQLVASGVRIFGPGATVAQDLEPEYIALSVDGNTAYVTLQENNALAIINLTGKKPSRTKLVPLGFKDHGKQRNALDAVNDDVPGDLDNYANLFGMYQPDGIAFANIGGQRYLFTANEGDVRDYDGFSEEAEVGDLNAPSFPDELDNLTVTSTLGEQNGVYKKLYAFGGRSFSVRNMQGGLVFDSGKMLEEIMAAQFPDLYDDGRSDNKGPEPEYVEVGRIGQSWFLFLGLERYNAVIVFDITKPRQPTFAGLLNRDGDEEPEGLEFVSSAESPTGKPLLLVANEGSGTTTAFELSVGSDSCRVSGGLTSDC